MDVTRGVARLGAVLAMVLLAAGGCSSDDGRRGDGPPDRAVASTTSGAPRPAEEERACSSGRHGDTLDVQPVDDVASDRTLASFDGTEIRFHWFPTPGADDAPRPTVLMGPGWSLPGDTDPDGAALFGAASISGLHEAGYNVLTWDPRGFGASGGTARVNSADAEGRDVQLLLDWVAQQPEARLDAPDDPRVGMVGFSYGGGIQLVVAAIDCRVDVIVPGLAWHSLESSLYKQGIVKAGWASVLVTAAVAGTVDPHVTSAYASGVEGGALDDEDVEWFRARGPADLVDRIEAPALFVHGTTDTLFTLEEAVTNHRRLRDRGVETAMIWFCGGHGTCLTEGADTAGVAEATFAWLARHLDGDRSVDTGPTVRFVDQEGTTWTADRFPLDEASTITAAGGGTLELRQDGGSGPYAGSGRPTDLLSGLVLPITPGRAERAVEVPIVAEEDALVAGAPRLSLTYSGSAPDGAERTHLFAQLVDEERDVVVGNQVTPVALVLDGTRRTTELDLELVVQHLDPGDELTLQLVGTTVSYATPALGGMVELEEARIELPVAAGAVRSAPASDR